MKFKLQLLAPATLILFLSSGLAFGQFSHETINEVREAVRELSNRNPGSENSTQQYQMIDPQTGLPVVPPKPEWKDPNWKDPDKVIPKVSYNNVPISEVARDISQTFSNAFDILLPYNFGQSSGVTSDWVSTPVKLELRNVTASEVFRAMNLAFENDRTPLRWELKVNGHRQIAMLRVLKDPMQEAAPPEKFSRVFFVGDLIGDPKSGGMTMGDIVKIISQIGTMTQEPDAQIRSHDKAQLLIVSGTREQVSFVEHTLSALHEKVEWERKLQNKSADSKPNGEESKSESKSSS
jgi:hypothetical protein